MNSFDQLSDYVSKFLGPASNFDVTYSPIDLNLASRTSGWRIDLRDDRLGTIVQVGETLSEVIWAVRKERRRRADIYVAIRDALGPCRSRCLDDEEDVGHVLKSIARAVYARLDAEQETEATDE